jgi:hypothetical protein
MKLPPIFNAKTQGRRDAEEDKTFAPLRLCAFALHRSVLAVVLVFASSAAHACSVCFGNSDSKLTQGMLAGVLVLLFCVLAVLGGFVALFIYLARRAAATAALENHSTESKA